MCILFQWELSLERLSKAHSGLGRTVGCIPTGWGTTGYMCQSRQFVSAWSLPCNPLPPESCHLSLCNQSFRLYAHLWFHNMARMLCCVLDKAFCMFRHVRLGAPRLFTCPVTWMGAGLPYDGGTCAFAEKWEVHKSAHCSCDFAHACRLMGMRAGTCSLRQSGCTLGCTGMSHSVQESHAFMRALLTWNLDTCVLGHSRHIISTSEHLCANIYFLEVLSETIDIIDEVLWFKTKMTIQKVNLLDAKTHLLQM